MIRRDWSTKPNYDVWNDLVYKQWWTDVQGTTGADGTYQVRGFLGTYDVDVTVNGQTRTFPITLTSSSQPAFVTSGKAVAGSIAANGVVNAASFLPSAVAPGELVTVYGSGFGPGTLAVANYQDGELPRSTGNTRVLFDGMAAPMVYATAGQVSAVAPYTINGATQM